MGGSSSFPWKVDKSTNTVPGFAPREGEMASQPLLSACCRFSTTGDHLGESENGGSFQSPVPHRDSVSGFTGFERNSALPWTHRRQRVGYAVWGFLDLKMRVRFLELSPGSCKLRETKETHLFSFWTLESSSPWIIFSYLSFKDESLSFFSSTPTEIHI